MVCRDRFWHGPPRVKGPSPERNAPWSSGNGPGGSPRNRHPGTSAHPRGAPRGRAGPSKPWSPRSARRHECGLRPTLTRFRHRLTPSGNSKALTSRRFSRSFPLEEFPQSFGAFGTLEAISKAAVGYLGDCLPGPPQIRARSLPLLGSPVETVFTGTERTLRQVGRWKPPDKRGACSLIERLTLARFPVPGRVSLRDASR